MFFNDDLNGNLNFDLVAKSYTSARPSYPKEIYHLILRLRELNSTDKISQVLEVGSGSGQATRQLCAISDFIDCIEPGDNFSNILNSIFQDNAKVKVHKCTYEEFESKKMYDLVFSASALHWVPRELAYEKSHNLLKKDGWLVAIWNMPRFSNEIYDLINEIIIPLDPGTTIPSGTKEQFDYFNEGFLDFSENRGFNECQKGTIESSRVLGSLAIAELIWSYVDINAIGNERSDVLFNELYTRVEHLGNKHTVNDYFPFAVGRAA